MRNYLALLSRVSILAIATLSIAHAQTQKYPDRPITLIVPSAPGGSTGILSRIVAESMSQHLGQPVVISNRSGGSGVIGTQAVARAAPDGYTLGLSAPTWFGINEVLNPGTIPYDSGRDFTTIALVARTKYVLVVPASSSVRTLKDLTALAKSKPGGISYASSAIAATPHLATEKYFLDQGLTGVRIDYQGSAAALLGLLRGDVDFGFSAVATVAQHIKSGRLRPLAVASAVRAADLPDVPTMAEAGAGPIDVTAWFGIFGPRGMAPEVVARLNEAIVKELSKPDEKQKLLAAGYEVETSSPEKFAEIRRMEVERSKLIIDKMKK